MLTNPTVTKLHEMRLSAMASAFKKQLEDAAMNELSFEDRFSLLVDAEWSTRKSNLLARLRKKAGYAIPGACIEDISYSSDRQLDKAQILRLASCSHIQNANNVIILGYMQQGRPIWLARWAMPQTGIITRRNISGFRTCWLKLPSPGVMELP